jgi:hypothetical protein
MSGFEPHKSGRTGLSDGVVFADVQGLPPEGPKQPHGRDFVRSTAIWAMGAREGWHRLQAALHVLRSDCQQMSAHPSEKNTSS